MLRVSVKCLASAIVVMALEALASAVYVDYKCSLGGLLLMLDVGSKCLVSAKCRRGLTAS
jgi:hypothetical protein